MNALAGYWRQLELLRGLIQQGKGFTPEFAREREKLWRIYWLLDAEDRHKAAVATEYMRLEFW